MNETLFEATTYAVDQDILEGIHATSADSWVDFILED